MSTFKSRTLNIFYYDIHSAFLHGIDISLVMVMWMFLEQLFLWLLNSEDLATFCWNTWN